jgi:AAA domain
MIAERRILPLEGGLMTTLTVRAREQAIERRFTTFASGGGRDVGVHARTLAGDQIAERIGGHLSAEQTHALEVITGPERAAILVGPAGTGKGVVIDAAAQSRATRRPPDDRDRGFRVHRAAPRPRQPRARRANTHP